MAKDINTDTKEAALLMLDQLDETRNDETKFDFKIKVEGETILAQRDILIAGSDYFKAILSHDTKENQKGEVEMKGFDFECVKICIDFIYEREISVPPEKYENLMLAADMMQSTKLCEEIEELMIENITQKTFFELRRIAELHKSLSLISSICKEFAEENFLWIRREKEFNDIDREYLLSLIKSKRTKTSEKEKLKILLKWVKHDPSRKSDTIYLLNGVNLDKIPIGYRRYLMEQEPLISEDFECFRKLSISVLNSAKLPMMDLTESSKSILIFDGNSKNLRLFNPDTNEVTETNLPKSNIDSNYSVTISGDHIYILGGENKSLHRLKYSDRSAIWERMADMMDDHGYQPPAVVLSGSIFVIGGCLNASTNTVEKYDTIKSEWKKLRGKPTKSEGAAVVAFNGFIYSMGGKVDGKDSKEVEALDVEKSRWAFLAPMNKERLFHSATEWEGNIIVAGGGNSAEHYNVARNEWTVFSSMITSRPCLRIFTIEGELFAVGGVDTGKSTIEKYHADKCKWVMVELYKGTELSIFNSSVVDTSTLITSGK